MKKLKILIFISIMPFAYSQTGQVGINTTAPTATLDVNGNTRIRNVDSIASAPKYILTSDDNGIVQKVNVEKLSDSNPEVIRRKIYAVLSKNSSQFLTTKGTDYNLTYDGVVSGINTDHLYFNSQKDRINLPPNKTFKITGYIGIKGSTTGNSNTTPGYITSLFSAGGDAEAIVTTQGYTESSTETFDDGGVTPPIIIVTTGSTGNAYVELKVRYGGSNAGNSGYYVSGASTRTSVGTYVLLEEL
ncbi:hypothetical protein MTQ00_03930 [Chryseobacterium sp. B21-037]|uniref:hypothetical protein n=1 Tax=Chryseobacterium sp. B21-037 TaxID=2926038 RepID=UPI0023585A68|nr:hypothetical protein [Chryseobacterium sp. B21-037]MDC8103680.1 hypothetical protein [Chryseobacterium sp. B21-037]